MSRLKKIIQLSGNVRFCSFFLIIPHGQINNIIILKLNLCGTNLNLKLKKCKNLYLNKFWTNNFARSCPIKLILISK